MTKAKTAKEKRTATVDEHDEVAKAPRDFYAALTDWRSRSGPIEPNAAEVFANDRRDRLLGTPLAVRLSKRDGELLLEGVRRRARPIRARVGGDRGP